MGPLEGLNLAVNPVVFLPGLGPIPRPRRRGGPPEQGRIQPNQEVTVSAEVYKRDVVLHVRHKQPRGLARPNPRGSITGFSPASRRRLQLLVRNTADMWDAFLTLTYPENFPMDGVAVKKQLHAFTMYLTRRKIAYLWILEFQRRGAPHFHVLIKGFIPKAELARTWYDIVGSWDPGHLAAGTRVEAIKNPDQVGAYMAAYMGKLDQKTVPKGYEHVGRFWGASRVLAKTFVRMKMLYRDAARKLRACRKFYGVKCRGWGFKWRWRGYGFWLKDGADFFRLLLKQAVLFDAGHRSWESWDGLPDPPPFYETPEQRILRTGQLLIDGGIDIDVNLPPTVPELAPPGAAMAEAGGL